MDVSKLNGKERLVLIFVAVLRFILCLLSHVLQLEKSSFRDFDVQKQNDFLFLLVVGILIVNTF